MIFSCQNREKIVDKTNLLGNDYRLFQQTPAWELAKAVSDENEKLIKALLKNSPNLINYQESKFGNTLLMMTIYNQQYKSFKILLEAGANVNIYDSNTGSSAIIEVCRLGNLDLNYMELLIMYGANINDIEVGNRKGGNTTRDTPLIAASRVGSLELVKFLIENGADINFENEYRQSALSKAILTNHYAVALYLLEQGAYYNKPLFHRENENRDIYILDLLKENHRPKDQEIIGKIINYQTKIGK